MNLGNAASLAARGVQEDESMLIDDFFGTGPFASASVNCQSFAENMYFNYLLKNSLQQRVELERAHSKALEENDIDLATKKKTELDYIDGIFKLTLEINPEAGGADS